MATSAEAAQRFEQEERAYWEQREDLLKQFAGKWIAIVGGRVVAVGDQMNKVAAEALDKTGSGLMYVNRVGHEDTILRVRSAVAGYYDSGYKPPLPMIKARVTDVRRATSIALDFVVDTGADLTVLQKDNADQVGLWNDIAGRLHVMGVGGMPAIRQLYNALVEIGGQSVLVSADCRDDIDEDILGRDVINEFRLTVCAKRDQVEMEWVDDAQP